MALTRSEADRMVIDDLLAENLYLRDRIKALDEALDEMARKAATLTFNNLQTLLERSQMPIAEMERRCRLYRAENIAAESGERQAVESVEVSA